jgi:CHAT domain-containing protein/tetratricopeptide (TPR) repeat protein
MLLTQFSGGSGRKGSARPEARAISTTLVLASAGLIGVVTAAEALAQSRPENPTPASSVSPTKASKVLSGAEALEVAALEKTIDELRRKRLFAEAVAPAREVLAIRLKALDEDNREIENSYLSLATILESLHRPAEAEPLRREALKVRLKRLRNDDIATISYCLDAVNRQKRGGNFAAAKSLTRSALEICRRIEHPDGLETAKVFTNLALRLEKEGQGADAEFPLRQAWTIQHRIQPADDNRTADASYHLARVLHLQGKDDEAARLCRTALELGARHRSEGHPQMVACRSLLASCQPARVEKREAEPKPRPSASPALRATGVQSSTTNEALGAIGAAGRVVAKDRGHIDGLANRRKAEAFTGSEFEPPNQGSAAGLVSDLGLIQAQIPPGTALVAWLDPAAPGGTSDPISERWACVIRSRHDPAWVRILGSGPRSEWTAADDHRLDQCREALGRRPDDHSKRWHEHTRAVARQWLAPLEQHLASDRDGPAVTRLIVLPSQALAGVPIETLVYSRIDSRPKYAVTYTPSAHIFRRLREKRHEGIGAKRPSGLPRLLALGDPVFAAPDHLETSAPGSSNVQREVPAPLSLTRGEAPRALPGTRREVLAIAGLFDRPETLLGSEASEQSLDGLAKAGRLSEFAFIHLATHGKLDGQDAQRSSLLLARDRLSEPIQQILDGRQVYDGELSSQQVLHTWELDAELVTLSACWSGAGRLGLFGAAAGFPHALILKGAQSVVLSLWNVDDAATAILMRRFYENLLGRRPGLDHPLPKAEALAEAKTWLRTRTAIEVDQLCANLPTAERTEKVTGPPRSTAKAARPYEHPYYWAAFILIGDPE